MAEEGVKGGKQTELWDKGLFMELQEDPGKSPLKWRDRELSPRIGDIPGLISVLASPELLLLLLPGFNADGITVNTKKCT